MGNVFFKRALGSVCNILRPDAGQYPLDPAFKSKGVENMFSISV